MVAYHVVASHVVASHVVASHVVASTIIARPLGGHRPLDLFCTETNETLRLVRSANHLASIIPLYSFATNNETSRGRTQQLEGQ
jgi:hypothetical protein